ncbi:MAG: outer membrane lipoprotein-sorting protein [Acidobacteria bacterium]|nr:outer membrane lipoprotein-sorting protein [Acidobacteriota bacterium]
MMYTRRAMLAFPAFAARAAETREERGRRVIADAIAALGGEKFLTMADRVEFGRAYSFYNQNLSGLSQARIYTRYLTLPEPPQAGFFGLRERQSFGKDEDYWIILTEDGAGYDVTYRGAKPLPPDFTARFKDTMLRNVFYILKMRTREPGMIMEHTGTEVFENQPVDKVDITDSENRTVTVYFHQSTHLPVRQVYFRRDPLTKDRMEEVSAFSKYRDVSGVMWPFVIRRDRNGEKAFELYAESVTINKGLDDTLFSIGTNVKILQKKKK